MSWAYSERKGLIAMLGFCVHVGVCVCVCITGRRQVTKPLASYKFTLLARERAEF